MNKTSLQIVKHHKSRFSWSKCVKTPLRWNSPLTTHCETIRWHGFQHMCYYSNKRAAPRCHYGLHCDATSWSPARTLLRRNRLQPVWVTLQQVELLTKQLDSYRSTGKNKYIYPDLVLPAREKRKSGICITFTSKGNKTNPTKCIFSVLITHLMLLWCDAMTVHHIQYDNDLTIC